MTSSIAVSEHTSNVATLALAAFHAALATGIVQINLPFSLSKKPVFWALTTVIALSNILGIPETLVKNQWEVSVFGDRFIPTKHLSVAQKRVLAGGMEIMAILASAFGRTAQMRGLGFSVLSVMYGRGAMINSNFSVAKMVLTTAVSLAALWYCSSEYSNYLSLKDD